MIYYFSATGNSLWAAQQLSAALGEQICDIAALMKEQPSGDITIHPGKDERTVLVFPIHSWGPALLMMRFARRLRIEGDDKTVWAVATCGDDCGQADKVLASCLRKRGIMLQAFYTLQMPNNYILMKGFDTDSSDVAAHKLAEAPQTINAIVQAIEGRGTQDGLCRRGAVPRLKSGVVYPLFARFVAGRQKFHATDACIGCGLCARICPTDTIVMKDGRPQWNGTDCVQCTACIHRCPARAIEYGNISQGKGRYTNPVLKKAKAQQ